jgi:anti-sigma factor RsiW
MSVVVLSTFHVHPTEDLLDEYVFGRLQEPALSTLEDHLFTCSSCQSTLAELDDYIRAMKTALAERQPENSASGPSRPAWAHLLGGTTLFGGTTLLGGTTMIWALALLLVLAGSAMLSWRTEPAPESVAATLTAFRGGDAAAFAHAPARRPLDLVIDGTSLPAAGAYRLQIVNASGQDAWSGAAVASDRKLSAHLSKGLGPGVYWVRLYASQAPGDAPGEAGLLREFGLRVD